MKLKIWLYFLIQKRISIEVVIRSAATVHEAIGFILYQVAEEGKEEIKCDDVNCYSLRIVEDDGSIDEDFPAIDRKRRLEKFSFKQYALCIDTSKIAAASINLP